MTEKNTQGMNRRSFLGKTAVAGAGMMFSPIIASAAEGKPDDINVGIIGAGAEGQVLQSACMKIPGVRFKAVCDIWPYHLKAMSRRLKAYKHENNAYADYKEMLAAEKDLDAVIVATPDFWHAPQTVDCLKAGMHVYCEKEMSNTLESAKKMVAAAKETGKLLQIGHQRRSNPRYIHCYDKLIKDANILGRITTIDGQWNRSARADLGWVKKAALDDATLSKYGFKNMLQFRNWRWYKGLGGGPMVDLGSHQIDIYSWFLGSNPKNVTACGGTDYYDKATHEWYDNVMAIFDYETPTGTVRAFYKVLTTNGYGGYYELFMGDQGSLEISESGGKGNVYRDKGNAPDWDKWVKAKYVAAEEKKAEAESSAMLDVRESAPPEAYGIPVTMDMPYHQPHLQNFFDAVRGKAKLNCPAEIGYETAVTVLKVNEAVEAAKRLDFTEAEFKA